VTVIHTFHALAFIENFSLKELAQHFPEAKRVHQQLSYPAAGGGVVFLFSFGVVIFFDVGQAGREGELLRLRRAPSVMRDAQVISEEFTVREQSGARPSVVEDGVLVVDTLTPERASMVALTVAQSAAMEYYERIVDQMFTDNDAFVQRLEKRGNISVFTAKLQRFIGAAISTRSEVISVLHLLDKPDVVWDDPGAERIYEELRSQFDLVDRYQSLELKLRSVQESLSLLTDIARDRRLVFLEASVILLILVEIVVSLVRH
jgi:required for meiotic nuclear division protein 1